MRIGRQSARRIIRGRHFSSEVTLRVQAVGTRNEHGEYVNGATTETTLRASAEPSTLESMKELRLVLPEGNRIAEAFTFFLATTDQNLAKALRVGTAQTNPDVIVYQGLNYCIRSVKDFTDHGHIMIVATREDGQDG